MPYTGKTLEFKNKAGQVVGRLGPTYLYPAEALALLEGAGFPDPVTALAVMKEESHLSPDAMGDLLIQDETWGPSVGVMQVRSFKSGADGRDARRLKDPKVNVAFAKELYDDRGFKPWGAYTSGRYKNHLAWARKESLMALRSDLPDGWEVEEYDPKDEAPEGGPEDCDGSGE